MPTALEARRRRPSLAQNEAMSAEVFLDEDPSYLKWLTKNPNGYIINIQKSRNPADARLHDANCWTLTVQLELGVKLTDPYMKVCGKTLAAVEDWAVEHVREPIQPCGHCRDTGSNGGNPGPSRRDPGLCPRCRLELAGTGKCSTCDED